MYILAISIFRVSLLIAFNFSDVHFNGKNKIREFIVSDFINTEFKATIRVHVLRDIVWLFIFCLIQ